MKKAATILFLSFLVMGIAMNSFPVLADDNSNDSGNDDAATANNANTNSDAFNSTASSGRDNSNENKNKINRGKTISELAKSGRIGELKELTKEFRENGKRVKFEREIETEDGKIKVKIKREIIDEKGNKKKVEIEIEREGNVTKKFKVKDKENRTTEIDSEVEIEDDASGNQSDLNAVTSDGEKHKIKVLPDEVKQLILQRLQTANISNMTLQEIKERNIPRVVYQIEANKHGKFLGVFKLAMKIDSQVDPETGQVLNANAPWWAFLVVGTDAVPPETNGTIVSCPMNVAKPCPEGIPILDSNGCTRGYAGCITEANETNASA